MKEYGVLITNFENTIGSCSYIHCLRQDVQENCQATLKSLHFYFGEFKAKPNMDEQQVFVFNVSYS